MAARIKWDAQAQEALEKIPDYIRPVAKDMIEKHAREKDVAEITLEFVTEARAELGI